MKSWCSLLSMTLTLPRVFLVQLARTGQSWLALVYNPFGKIPYQHSLLTVFVFGGIFQMDISFDDIFSRNILQFISNLSADTCHTAEIALRSDDNLFYGQMVRQCGTSRVWRGLFLPGVFYLLSISLIFGQSYFVFDLKKTCTWKGANFTNLLFLLMQVCCHRPI